MSFSATVLKAGNKDNDKIVGKNFFEDNLDISILSMKIWVRNAKYSLNVLCDQSGYLTLFFNDLLVNFEKYSTPEEKLAAYL